MSSTYAGKPCKYCGNIRKYRANRNCTKCCAIATKQGHMRRLYGLTRAELAVLVLESEGLCKICGEPMSGNRNCHIDHCHTTGNIRGLLCGNCNVGIGHFKENIELLTAAIKYLGK